MKKAVILVGGKQYLVEEKETLRVDLLPEGTALSATKPKSAFTKKLAIVRNTPKLKSPKSVKISPPGLIFYVII